MGLSLGKTHYVLHALLDKGLVKIRNFRRNDNKLAYAYLLTPKGVKEKLRLTRAFWRARKPSSSACNRPSRSCARRCRAGSNPRAAPGTEAWNPTRASSSPATAAWWAAHLVRRLQAGGFTNILTRTRGELDLLDGPRWSAFLREQQPDYIFIAAAKVGGIQANNQYRADFLYQNLMIEANLIHGAHLAGVQRLMFLGSSCIYPRDCPQPIKEDYLLTGPLEPPTSPTRSPRSPASSCARATTASTAGSTSSVMPTNLYGPNDNYDLATSHVLPALIRKAHEAKLRGDAEYVVWGSGTPRREFLYVDDLADACVHLMERDYDGPLVNIGTGDDVTIRELAETVMAVVGFERPHRLRPQQARRHAAQAARREPARRAGLARPHVVARWHPPAPTTARRSARHRPQPTTSR